MKERNAGRVAAAVVAAGLAAATASGRATPPAAPSATEAAPGPILPTATAAGTAPVPAAWLTLAAPSSVTLFAGRGETVRLALTVAPGYHVQANVTRTGFIPTTLSGLIPVGGISFGRPVWPKGRPLRLEGDTEYLNVYEGTVTVAVPVRVSSRARPGRYGFAGLLEYQACDAQVCYPPRTLTFDLTVFVVRP